VIIALNLCCNGSDAEEFFTGPVKRLGFWKGFGKWLDVHIVVKRQLSGATAPGQTRLLAGLFVPTFKL
jgi:hypothetical protein